MTPSGSADRRIKWMYSYYQKAHHHCHFVSWFVEDQTRLLAAGPTPLPSPSPSIRGCQPQESFNSD